MTLPGVLFAELWQLLIPHTGDILGQPWAGRNAGEFSEILRLFTTEPSIDIPHEIEEYLALGPVSFTCSVFDVKERGFVVMCALDEAAMMIHPAFPNRLPGIARRPTGMLVAMRNKRTSEGFYADVPGVGLVIPKGHLMSRVRPNDREDASGTDLSNQFEHLIVLEHLRQGRSVRFVVPNPTKIFVTPDRADYVGLAPIAEDRNDLRFITSERGGRPYLDTQPSIPDLANRIQSAVTALLDDGAGVIVLPELVSTSSVANELAAVLKARGSASGPAIVLAGTGASDVLEIAGARPHNEAVLMTSGGRILGKQRKLHLFNMDNARMRDCDITPAVGCSMSNHLEDAAVGTELVVYDIHGLGRVMILICEDLQQQTPGGDVALIARPDWILTPVLDISQTEGRWTHQRAIEIGRKTLSRVVVSCSGTLGVRKARVDRLADALPLVNIGICFDGLVGNRAKLVVGTGAITPDRVVVAWESETWDKHRIKLVPV
ncbi:nitrilase-related carbon-nitrogen hydrolase [Azospirillum sp. SYSU D00513]|uniref:nitrilase-related carbon-nitrogen hydrolase n=1 Tax=Azospirillum sp. SYSU D00513 TaxID=2812561 RepID=UPI001A9690A6|nr:nitrilase-related carbon-nitrogen hydrolase [Azospirillum sp. SYSU D00513]